MTWQQMIDSSPLFSIIILYLLYLFCARPMKKSEHAYGPKYLLSKHIHSFKQNMYQKIFNN